MVVRSFEVVKVLFLVLVYGGNVVVEDNVGYGVFGNGYVVVFVGEMGYVVVFDKGV